MKILMLSIISLTLILFSLPKSKAQEWTVPPDESKLTSPLPFTAENIAQGEEIYQKNCKSCHGDPGKNNPLAGLNPVPPDFASEKYQKNTDGDLFYKISNGRGTMPQFKAILSEEQRWMVITYARSFNPDYKPSGNTVATQEIKGAVTFDVQVNEATRKIIIKATKTEENQEVKPLAEESLKLFVKRYFGKLQFATVRTNQEGVAIADFPQNIRGDTFGYCTLIVKAGSSEATIEKVKIGKPFTPPDIYAKRSLWSWNAHTQWWIILSYLGVVLGVWATILYVVYLISRIPKAGIS